MYMLPANVGIVYLISFASQKDLALDDIIRDIYKIISMVISFFSA